MLGGSTVNQLNKLQLLIKLAWVKDHGVVKLTNFSSLCLIN